MNSSLVKDVIWAESEEFAGRISVNLASGKVDFLTGPPELEEAVRSTLSSGPHHLSTIQMNDGSVGVTTKRTLPDDPMFELDLDGTLGLSGFAIPV